jgi:serine/threonine-protein kinase
LRALLILSLWIPAAAFAQDYFGAIAYSPSSGAHGWANDQPSRAAAERAALTGCRSHADDCRTVVWFKNACGTLATGPKVYGWGWGATQELADGEAMKACAQHASRCTVKQRLCTTR